jgi:uncharacterized membrane protein
MEPERFAALDARLQHVEREAAALRAELSALAGTPHPVPPPVPPGAFAAPPHPAAPRPAAPGAPPSRAPISLEGLVAGRGLQLAGLFLVLLGAAFFLNLAFTRGWVGPVERIVLGLVAGAALIAEGARRARPAQAPLAETLVALGSGILYLSLWASVAVFPQLHVPRAAAFVAMAAVTTVLAVLAATRRSERIALLGLAGGFLTPLLLSADVPDRTLLAAYVLVLGGSFAALGVVARFRFVEAAAFIASMLYLPAFAPAGREWPVTAAYAVTSAIAVLFACAFSAATVRDAAAAKLRSVLLAADVFAYAAMLTWIFAGHQTQLGIALLVLAAALLIAARALAPLTGALTVTFAYLGLGAATLALPALLHRHDLLDAFAVEGAVLIAIGTARRDRYPVVSGYVILAFAALWAIGEALGDPPAQTPFSSLALSFAIVLGALAFARLRLTALALSPVAAVGWTRLASIAVNVVAVSAITRVLLDALGGPHWDTGVPSHAQVAVSLAWTAYAAGLFGIGMQRGSASMRQQGLVLFVLTVVKVIVVDLNNVDVAWRIASAVVLGVVCIAASAWYMRAQAAGKAADA